VAGANWADQPFLRGARTTIADHCAPNGPRTSVRTAKFHLGRARAHAVAVVVVVVVVVVVEDRLRGAAVDVYDGTVVSAEPEAETLVGAELDVEVRRADGDHADGSPEVGSVVDRQTHEVTEVQQPVRIVLGRLAARRGWRRSASRAGRGRRRSTSRTAAPHRLASGSGLARTTLPCCAQGSPDKRRRR
jgi:hypothetical protein